MRFDAFTFSEIDQMYGGEISFKAGNVNVKIKDRNTFLSLIELVDGLADCWAKKKQLVRVEMHEETNWYDLFLIDYPSGFLKIEIYKDALWECYLPDRYTPRNPILSGFYDYHAIAFLISEEIERHGPGVFKDSKYPYPAEGLDRLRRLIVGANPL